MRKTLLTVAVTAFAVAACGNQLAAEPVAPGASSADEEPPDTVSPEPTSVTTGPSTAGIPTEPTIHRPDVVAQGSTVSVEFPLTEELSDSSTAPSLMHFSIVELDGQVDPYLRVDASDVDAAAADRAAYWILSVDGRRRGQFGVTPGSEFGTRLDRESAANGPTIRIWSEDASGEQVGAAVEFEMETYRGS